MARFRSDRRTAGTALLLALAAMNPAVPAELSGALTIDNWSRLEHNVQDDSTSIDDARISHGSDMSIKAGRAVRALLPGNVNRLMLSGGVHIDYRGAVLDAETALVVFRGQQLQSARVQGSQATFSHQPAGSPRRVRGQANAIEFDGASNRVRFSGKTSYTDGRTECNVEELYYSLADGSIINNRPQGENDRCTVDLDAGARVPTPRTPDRSTSQ